MLNTLFALIKSTISGIHFPDGTNLDYKELYALSKKHDLVHLVAESLIKNNLLEKDSGAYQAFSKEKIKAIYRYEQQNHELKNVRDVFQKNNIQFVPLKGSILRDYYPEPWMRTSCDIDILIHEEDLEKAKDALLSIGFTTDGVRNYHDISFLKGLTHVELHFNICEANKQLDTLLSKVWDYVKQYDGYEYRETNEYFVFHHIAHMAYHFLTGGCGIRPVLDLWILRNKQAYDEEELIKLLNQCHLVSFYKQACLLSEVWFDDKPHDETTLLMEKHIIDGGVYGTQDKGAVTGLAKHKGSKTRYKLSIAFPPYKDMCNIYPKLIKHKLLLPFYYIHRIFSKCFGKNAREVRKRSKVINNASRKEAKEFSLLINKLGLE